MSHNDLAAYYETIFIVTSLHKICTLTEFEQLMPFEKDIYLTLLQKRMQEEKEANERNTENIVLG